MYHVQHQLVPELDPPRSHDGWHGRGVEEPLYRTASPTKAFTAQRAQGTQRGKQATYTVKMQIAATKRHCVAEHGNKCSVPSDRSLLALLLLLHVHGWPQQQCQHVDGP